MSRRGDGSSETTWPTDPAERFLRVWPYPLSARWSSSLQPQCSVVSSQLSVLSGQSSVVSFGRCRVKSVLFPVPCSSVVQHFFPAPYVGNSFFVADDEDLFLFWNGDAILRARGCTAERAQLLVDNLAGSGGANGGRHVTNCAHHLRLIGGEFMLVGQQNAGEEDEDDGSIDEL